MSSKEEALREIVALAHRHHLSGNDIFAALGSKPISKDSSRFVSRLLGYFGALFIFAGLCVFTSMYWDDMGSAGRVIVTLGSGFVLFVMALVCLGDTKYDRLSMPLFLMSAALQPSGILVMLKEYASGGDPHYGVLFMAFTMLVQQSAVFWAKKMTTLAFTSIVFGCIFFTTLFDLWGLDGDLIGFVMGLSLMCLAYALDRSEHALLAPFWYFVGSVSLLVSSFDALKHTTFELVHLALSSLLIYLSTYVRSRTLLAVSTISLLSYIGYFTEEHFAHTLGWPLALIIFGVALIGMSSFALRLNRKYIQA